MEISFDTRGHTYKLVVKAENVLIEEEAETRSYPKKKDGSTDYFVGGTKDVSAESLAMVSDVLQDMVYHRTAPFASQGLIEELFGKLGAEAASVLSKKLYEEYFDTE